MKPQQLTARIRAPVGLHIGLGVENISLGGAFVKCNTVIPVASRVSLELTRPGAAQPIVIPAQVTVSVSPAEATRTGRPPGVGLTFLSLAPHVEAWLTHLVQSLAPKPVAAAAPPVLEPVRARRVLPPSRPPPDPEVTQPGVPVPGDAEQALRKEVQQLRARLAKHEALLEELTIENRKLRSLLKGGRPAPPGPARR